MVVLVLVPINLFSSSRSNFNERTGFGSIKKKVREQGRESRDALSVCEGEKDEKGAGALCLGARKSGRTTKKRKTQGPIFILTIKSIHHSKNKP